MDGKAGAGRVKIEQTNSILKEQGCLLVATAAKAALCALTSTQADHEKNCRRVNHSKRIFVVGTFCLWGCPHKSK